MRILRAILTFYCAYVLLGNMAKVDLDLVKMVLTRADIDAVKVAQIIEDIAIESKMADEGKEKEPAVKKQYVVIVSDPDGDIKSLRKDFMGWVVQIPEDDNPASALEKLEQAAFDFNSTPRGRRIPLMTYAEACENASPKIYKESKIWVKSKEPVLLIRADRNLPKVSKGKKLDF